MILTGFSGEPDAQLAAIRAEHPDALIVPGTVGITDSAWWGRAQHLASQESLESCYTEGMSEKTSAETVRTVRKDSTDRVTGERKRGRTHQVNDPFSGQTWCGRKPRGLAHRNYHDDPANVDCPDCLSAIETGRPKPYSRR